MQTRVRNNLPKFREVVKNSKAELKNYGSGKSVYVRWGWNSAVHADQMFEIKIGKESAILSWEEVQHYLRAV